MFTDPAKRDMPRPDLAAWRTAYEFLHKLSGHPLYRVLVTSEEERYLAWTIACIVPFAQIANQGAASGNLKRKPPLATVAAREGIKATNKVSELITAAWRDLNEIREMRDVVCSKGERLNDRAYFGMAIRRWEAHGKYWRLQVLFAMLDDVMRETRDVSDAEPVLATIRSSWASVVDHLQKLDLLDAPSIRPLIDGHQLSKALGIKSGRWMSPAMDVCMEWQLRNPEETEPAGAVEAVLSLRETLGIAKLLP